MEEILYNRQLNGEKLYSELLKVKTTGKYLENQDEEDYVDLYIFLDKEYRGRKTLSFRVPFTYILENNEGYHFSIYEGWKITATKKILHQMLLGRINDDDSNIEDCYLSFLSYLCFGREFENTIERFSNMNFGVIASFDNEFRLKEWEIVDPEKNLSFHCQNDNKYSFSVFPEISDKNL